MRALAVAMVALAWPLHVPAATVALVNPGFESTKAGNDGNPEGWGAFQHAAESFEFAVDDGRKKSGKHSMRIRKVGPEPWGAITQAIPGAPYAGKTVRLSAWMRTDAVPEGGRNGAMLLLHARRGSTVLAEIKKKTRVRGTTDWTRHVIELALPPATHELEFGAMLEGGGTLWLDDFELEVVEP
jgi:hypothetical protein